MKGRGSAFNPPNRFERLHLEPLPPEDESAEEKGRIPTQLFRDTSKTILAKNDSPDIPFTYSINPYRGCEHGCIYCYARPSHEYLGFSAGLDFETKIMVKMEAPQLLDAALSNKNWRPQTVAFSGNTDCYQPSERRLQLTRKCLEVFLRFRNPTSIITKNALVLRDLDILRPMAQRETVHVAISMITLDEELSRKMEPRASMPAQRLQTIEGLAKNGIPVSVNVAPVIPGLTDSEIPSILREAAARGATSAGYSPVRLQGAVAVLFTEWVRREFPDRASRILHRIQDIHGGALNDSRFGYRMTGQGTIADTMADLFTLHAAKFNLADRWQPLSTRDFRRQEGSQMEIFG